MITDLPTGVGNIKRAPQEHALIVLFSTAISNLVSGYIVTVNPFTEGSKVLFRDNFSFNRDIVELFQSFQSSASILDPAANPTLFQSTLIMIIEVGTYTQMSFRLLKSLAGCSRARYN
jgi:hypothetical protein